MWQRDNVFSLLPLDANTGQAGVRLNKQDTFLDQMNV